MADFDPSREMGFEPAQDRLAFPCKTHHRVARDGEADAVVRGVGDGRSSARPSLAGAADEADERHPGDAPGGDVGVVHEHVLRRDAE